MSQGCVKGLYRIGPGSLSGVSCHLVVEDHHAVLIDSGFIGHHWSLKRLMRRLKLPPESLKAVLQTHGHLDHVGRLFEICQWAKVKAYMHPADRPIVLGSYPYRGWARVCGVLEKIGRPLIGFQQPEIHHDLHDGQMFDWVGGLQVVSLPGHTEGHCGFYRQRDRLLFAGDLIAAFGVRPHLSPVIFNAVPHRYAQAFKTVLALDPQYVVLNHYVALDPVKQAEQLKKYAEHWLAKNT